MKKIIIIIVVSIVLLISILFLLLGNNIADTLVNLNKDNNTIENSIKQLELWGYNYEDLTVKYTIHKDEITSDDGNIIPIYYIGDSDYIKKDTVVLVHGLGGDYSSTLPQAHGYIEKGYNVISYDQRGSGISTNPYVTFGFYEKNDLKAIIKHIKKISSNKVLIHGFSMGAATTALYSGEDYCIADLIILDSSFDSMESVCRSYFEDTGLPPGLGILSGDIFLKIKYGFGFDDADMKKALSKCNIPVLIIHSTEDKVAPIEMGYMLYDSVMGKRDIWISESGHIEAFILDSDLYLKKVMSFIDSI